jgi:hypothetical protein
LKFRGHWSGGTRSGRGQLFASNGSLIFDGEVTGDLKTGTGNDFIDGKIYYAGHFNGQLFFFRAVQNPGECMVNYYENF